MKTSLKNSQTSAASQALFTNPILRMLSNLSDIGDALIHSMTLVTTIRGLFKFRGVRHQVFLGPFAVVLSYSVPTVAFHCTLKIVAKPPPCRPIFRVGYIFTRV